MSVFAPSYLNSKILRLVIDHVFMPPKLPQEYPGKRKERKTNVALCNSLIEAAQDFLQFLPPSEGPLWMQMIKMIELARRAAKAPFNKVDLQRVLSDMDIGDVFCIHIRAQNAALIIRRLATTDSVRIEVFEVSPLESAVMKAEGKLLCSYPGPAVQIPTDIFMDECFLRELSSFLVQMDVDYLPPPPMTSSTQQSDHESAHPGYISELLVGILRGYGQPAVVDCVTKRIGDEVLFPNGKWEQGRLEKLHRWLSGKETKVQGLDKPRGRSILWLIEKRLRPSKPWRRSPLWLILRVSLQTSLGSTNIYKPFILFFHTHLLRICVRQDFPSELLYVMRAKMARRLSKVGPGISRDICQFVHDTANETEALLSKRWTAFQTVESISPTPLFNTLDCVVDAHVSLNCSYKHLRKALGTASHSSSRSQFIPSHGPRLCDVYDFTQFTNGRLRKAIAGDPHIVIADFELSVERNLESWTDTYRSNNNASKVIASCIQQYYTSAKDLYKANPEDNSIMILTIMDLWVALDRIAIHQCPLLKEYSPEIPSNFLHSILLHRSSGLKRALRIEEYLSGRHKEALGVTSVFSNSFDDSCFAVKAFRASEDLQHLDDRITTLIRRAPVTERAKCGTPTSQYRMFEFLLRHTFDMGDKLIDAPALERSFLLSVPTHLIAFELSPPRAFSSWRDMTYMILNDIGLHSVTHLRDRFAIFLSDFPILQSLVARRQGLPQVTLAFSDQNGRNTVRNPSEDIPGFLLDTGLSFGLFDSIHDCCVMAPFSGSSSERLCTPPFLKSSPYSSLHHFVSSTQHAPNTIIAAQADCPDEIDLHEFLAFSGLRCGPRLQWFNIARELTSPYLSFSREEVHTLITQAAWQLGPLSNGSREWHVDLDIFSFGGALLRALGSLLRVVQANWKEEVTVRTIALICSRLLSSTTDPDIALRACTLLREARAVAHRWVNEISRQLDSTEGETSRADIRNRLCMLAATCFSTFDVCPQHIPATLSSEEDFSVAMQCAVIIHDNAFSPVSLPKGDEQVPGAEYLQRVHYNRMLRRHYRLLHNLEPIFSQSFPPIRGRAELLHGSAYDVALSRLWVGYRRCNASSWHTLPKPNSRWISCVTQGGQKLHYDLLTGKLLIDGKRLGGLLKEIVEHSTYRGVFRGRIVEVVPADIPGVDYITRSTVSGYEVLFSWKNQKLILKARKPGDSQILQLIPQSILKGDFPAHFVYDYIHWLDLSTGELEFRPAESQWMSRPSNWRLYVQKPRKNTRAVLEKPSQGNTPTQLIDIRSRTFDVVCGLLSPLELPTHIIATHTARTLEVSLPRFRLSFFVNTIGELECRNMPGYVVDKFQSCGTMFGLRNKLILCPGHTSSDAAWLPRKVIIPQGEIHFRTEGDFTSVSIKHSSGRHVGWHEYTIDTDLGRLTSNGNLNRTLYQCYLHALTSHCLPDPLLNHTGTEEALYILRGAACTSFQRVDFLTVDLLELIGALSAFGKADLPGLSQHHDFFRNTCTILNHAQALEVLYDRPDVFFEPPEHHQGFLNRRAAYRNKLYYPSDLHIPEESPCPGDVEYRSRVVSNGTGEQVAFQTSWSIWNGRPSLDNVLPQLWDLVNSWRLLGPAGRGAASLRYSRYWVDFEPVLDWVAIYNLCRNSVNRNRRDLSIELSFSFSAAAFSLSRRGHLNVIPFIVIFALDERCRNLSLPPNVFYELSDGLAPELTHLRALISQSALSISLTPAHDPLNVEGTRNIESLREALRDEELEYSTAIREKSSLIAQSILQQWPDYTSVDFHERWFKKSEYKRKIKEYIRSMSANTQLREHILQLQGIVQHYQDSLIPTTMPYVQSPQPLTSSPNMASNLLRDVLASRTDTSITSPEGEPFPRLDRPSTSTATMEGIPPWASSDSLGNLIEELRNSSQPLLQLYGNELRKSHHQLMGHNGSLIAQGSVPSHNALLRYYEECSHRKETLFSQIAAILAPSQNVEETSRIAGLWPRITPRTILDQLAQNRIGRLPERWKFVLTRYAVSFIKCQQSRRLLQLSSRQKYEKLLQEMEAIYNDVLAESTPDWLLVQIDANLVARPVQITVAREMISPTSMRNICLQLNMGEGKSSVILPLVASTLANGSDLVRVVTLKPLSNQMFELLVSRLAGLANRPIFYVPISRSLRMDTFLVRTIRGLFERCVAEGGVLVVQPEHVLSLKLMHIDNLLFPHRNGDERSVRSVLDGLSVLHGSVSPARYIHDVLRKGEEILSTSGKGSDGDSITDELGALQDRVAKLSRDILDESDEILHVQYQLIYTAGEKIPVHDHPNRWTTIQQVLSRLQAHAMNLSVEFPTMVEVDTRLGGFPNIRILDSTIVQRISSVIIDDALKGKLSNLPLDTLPPPIQSAARRFMSQREVSDVDHNLIHSHCAGTTLFNGILLLRGLLMDSEGILGYVLKERRWRVDYGLNPSRTLLAVPYRAKDVPNQRAEFAHPDVAITLTCLSYYYVGLTKLQVLSCFTLLAKLDDPEIEYDYWVGLGNDLPAELCYFKGVNTQDKNQVNRFLVPLFSRNKRVVDFYLSQVVFPRDAREFPSKLPTSAWDLVEEKTNVTTGFSGTNDNRFLLPISITQEDPDFSLDTNALVLRHLLLPQNDHYECTEGGNGERELTTAFLERLVRQGPEIRVLLDVGAQMLELRNEELARRWLSLRPDVLAAIFFDDSDNLTVITPDGTIEPFISSPFNQQLERCLVYLDDAHTRGTDLNFPQGTRAAVTLGLKVTKDRLVQGCMRMRQLGKGHSVVFFAPGEVDRRIRGLIPDGIAPGTRVRVLDVIRWAIHETCEDISHYLPYWAHQGLDHHKRFAAYEEYRSSGGLEVLRSAWQQPESQTLEEMYWISAGTKKARSHDMYRIPLLSERIELLGATKLVDVRMTEEQEREVNHEVDPAHVVERPPQVQPAEHMIHADIRDFVETGKLPESPTYISPLLVPINMARALDQTIEWSPTPLASADFTTVTDDSDGVALTDFLRPVNWILSSGSGKDSIVIVISPYEANELLPIIRKTNKVRLHIYAPRVTFSMRSFSDLTFHSIPNSLAEPWSAPAHVRTELNLFAGQLFFDNKAEYERVCVLLGLSRAHPGAEKVELDGFVLPAYRTGKSSPFAKSRIPILKKLIELRQKGKGYHRTHLGQILSGKPLSEEALLDLPA